MFTIVDGVVQGVNFVASPNFEQRPEDCEIDLLVIHAISLPPGKYGYQTAGGVSAVEALFTNTLDASADAYFAEIADLKVSAHLYIDRFGAVTQFVNLNDRAWHAGESTFCGKSNCNDFSIGIELEGCDEDEFEPVQYTVLSALIQQLKTCYPGIHKDNIVGHSDIAPGRKTDPGPYFNWNLLLEKISN